MSINLHSNKVICKKCGEDDLVDYVILTWVTTESKIDETFSAIDQKNVDCYCMQCSNQWQVPVSKLKDKGE